MTLTAVTTAGYTLVVADDPAQVASAQRLRHRVFGEELGATLRSRCRAATSTTSTPSVTT